MSSQSRYCKVLTKIVKLFIVGKDELREQKFSEHERHVLEVLESEGVIIRDGDTYRLNVPKYELLIHALRKGCFIDLEKSSKTISWRDFEHLIKEIFRSFNFNSICRLRFSLSGRAFEIDVMSYKKPTIMIIEAKRRKRISTVEIKKIVNHHVSKVELISKNIDLVCRKLGIDWNYIELMPLILTLHKHEYKVLDGVPIVSISQLFNFLQQFEEYKNCFKIISVERYCLI
ncbi:MAG: hypothetical protein B6V02_00140 [Thermoprotei archaeon ex4572_64]|nr:MAG: hypothetical protein B6V02_00140 [Thermoprotei archaeon ex4572_64]